VSAVRQDHDISVGIWRQHPARAKFKMQVAISNDSHARRRMLVWTRLSQVPDLLRERLGAEPRFVEV